MTFVAYRWTIYESRHVDPTETTVLAPIAGASHADPFQVATVQGSAGFKPYLGYPEGRRGRIDILEKKVDVGTLTVPVLDVRTGGVSNNLIRWVTAFGGDAQDLPRFGALKCFLEESLDGGLTWAPFFTGRIQTAKLNKRLWYAFTVKDMSDDLKYPIFVGKPHPAVYSRVSERRGSPPGGTSQLCSVMPVGFVYPYGNARTTAPLKGTISFAQCTGTATGTQTATTLQDTTQAWVTNQWANIGLRIVSGTGAGQVRLISANTATTLTIGGSWTTTPDATSVYQILDPHNNWALLTLGTDQRNLPENQWTKNLQQATTPSQDPFVPPASAPLPNKVFTPNFFTADGHRVTPALAHVKRTDTNLEGDFVVAYGWVDVSSGSGFGGVQTTNSMWGLCIAPLRYPVGAALGTPQANGAQSAQPLAPTGSVSIKGWTASVHAVLRVGDIVSFAGHLQRYTVFADTDSDGSGIAVVSLMPGLQAPIANNEAMTVQSSIGRMDLPPPNVPIELWIVVDQPLSPGGGATIVGPRGPTDQPDAPGNILLVNDEHPAQFILDICNGYYGFLFTDGDTLPPGKNLGDPRRTFPVVLSTFTPILQSPSFGTFRGIFDKREAANAIIEKVCKNYGLGYYLDANGALNLLDLRTHTTLAGAPSLTDADMKLPAAPAWSYEAEQAKTIGRATIYAEALVHPVTRLFKGDQFPEITSAMFQAQGYDLFDISVGNPALGELEWDVDCFGFRAMAKETIRDLNNEGTLVAMSRWDWIKQNAIRHMHDQTRSFGNGPMWVKLVCRRTANSTAIWPGTWFVAQISELPDPVSLQRGGARAMICTERSEHGLDIEITAVDSGANIISGAPTLGTPATLSGDTSHSCTCLVTPNAVVQPNGVTTGQPYEVMVAVTDQTITTRPLDTSHLWHYLGIGVAAQVWMARGLPAGGRVWWRARSLPKRVNQFVGPTGILIPTLQLPSAWAYGAASVDLTGLQAVTGLASTNVQATAFGLTWANADPQLAVEVWALQNFIENGDYEVDAVGANANGGSTIARDATNVHNGAWALKLTTNNANNEGVYWLTRAGARIAVTPPAPQASIYFNLGVTYTLGFWIFGVAGKTFAPKLEWWTATSGGSLISTTVGSTVTLVAGWQWVTFTATAPISALAVVPTFYTTAAQGVFSVWLDAVQLWDSPLRLLDTLAPGSTGYTMRQTQPSTTYHVAVRVADGSGGYAEASVEVLTAASDAPVAPVPVECFVQVGL